MKFEIQNTQNKVYNIPRRSYIDEGDCKEGESICRKCEGIGQVTTDGGPIMNCSKCLGRGIVDWISQAVVRPPQSSSTHGSSGTSMSSSSNGQFGSSSCVFNGNGKVIGPHIPLQHQGNIHIKKVTNYKRRKTV